MKKNKANWPWLRITRVQAMSRSMMVSHRFKKHKTMLWTSQQLPKASTLKIAPDQIQMVNRLVMLAQETGHTHCPVETSPVVLDHGHVQPVQHVMNSLPSMAVWISLVVGATKSWP